MVNSVLMYIFLGFALLLAVAGFLRRARRAVLWLAASLAACSAVAAHFDAFWPMAMLGMGMLWMAILGLNFIDMGWCFRFGMTLTAALLAFIVLWPTLDTMSGGKIACPAWVKQHVKFRLVSGLDLRGGMRLVYTVDVDEAIKDKRDRYFEDMRVELSKVFGLYQGNERPSEEVYVKLRDIVEIDAPRRPANTLRIIGQARRRPEQNRCAVSADFLRRHEYDALGRSANFDVYDEIAVGICDSRASGCPGARDYPAPRR